ncbi:MAG: AAA family ATPase [Thermodesulfobacteriota bacterium]|nr:AAA family ATPase [Thermodesulfobacteriota bacterium]
MYEDFYYLNEKPFNATPDPKFLYLGEHHEEALANLMYGVHERKGFIVLTGEVGAGKTTLIRTLLERLNNNVKTAYIFNPNLTVDSLFSTILDEFNLEHEYKNKADFLRAFNNFLIECLERDEIVILIIDESQNLSPSLLEEIRLLLNLETSKNKLLQVILSGQPELNQKLELPQLRQLKQRIGLRYHIPPLTKRETKYYIRERIRIAGSKDFSPFTDKAINKIYRHTKGIPRLINILCDNTLLTGYATNQLMIGPAIVNECAQDLQLDTIRREPKNEVPRSFLRNPFKRVVWRLALVLIIIPLIVAGNSSFHSGQTPHSSVILNEEKMIPADQTSEDISERVRKKIIPSMETEFHSVGNANTQQISIKKSATHERNVSLIRSAETYYAVTVLKSDTLIGIASRRYGWVGKDILEHIKEANPEIKDLNDIKIGQKIFLPLLNEDKELKKSKNNKIN